MWLLLAFTMQQWQKVVCFQVLYLALHWWSSACSACFPSFFPCLFSLCHTCTWALPTGCELATDPNATGWDARTIPAFRKQLCGMTAGRHKASSCCSLTREELHAPPDISYTFLSQSSQNSSVRTWAEFFLQLDGEEGKNWKPTLQQVSHYLWMLHRKYAACYLLQVTEYGRTENYLRLKFKIFCFMIFAFRDKNWFCMQLLENFHKNQV